MKKIILKLIKIYQKTLSPTTGIFAHLFSFRVCRFQPTCSEYTYQAIEKYGIIKGSFIGFWRVLRCNPFSKGGFEPIPSRKESQQLFLKGLIAFFVFIGFLWLVYKILLIVKL